MRKRKTKHDEPANPLDPGLDASRFNSRVDPGLVATAAPVGYRYLKDTGVYVLPFRPCMVGYTNGGDCADIPLNNPDKAIDWFAAELIANGAQIKYNATTHKWSLAAGFLYELNASLPVSLKGAKLPPEFNLKYRFCDAEDKIIQQSGQVYTGRTATSEMFLAPCACRAWVDLRTASSPLDVGLYFIVYDGTAKSTDLACCDLGYGSYSITVLAEKNIP